MIASIKIALFAFVSLLIGTQPVASGGTTPYEVGPGRVMRDYVYTTTANNTARLSTSQYFVVDLPILAWATGTGSSTGGYQPKSICIPNPLTKLRQGSGTGTAVNMNRGSGAILETIYHNVKSPAAVGGDVGFSESCAPAASSGQSLLNDVCTATGCTTKSTTVTDWNGAKYLTLTLRDNPTTAFRASLFLRMTDIAGE